MADEKARRTEPHGAGMTERTVKWAGRDHIPDFLRDFMQRQAAARPETFQGRVAEVKEAATAWRDDPASRPPRMLADAAGNDSAEDYGRRILKMIKIVEKEIAAGRADAAAVWAYRLGGLVQEALTKAEWEPHALRGLGMAKGAADAGRKRWEEKGWKQRAPEIQAALDRKHAERPGFSYARLRDLVALELGCSDETVKRYGKNPRK